MKHLPRSLSRVGRVSLISVAATAALCASFATTAHAATPDDTSSTSAVLAVSPAAAGAAADQNSATDGNTVTVSGETQSITVTLPVSASATESVSNGLVSVSDSSASSIVPIVQEDGSVAVHSVLKDRSAPTAYEYDLGLPAGATLTVDPSGSIVGLNADGSFAVGVAAPWATDANGTPVPTSYTVSGTTLTQHILVTEDTAFPVVADPWLGVDLVAEHGWYNDGNGPRININPTLWARGFTGQSFFIAVGNAGWDELWNKAPYLRFAMNESAKQQYVCHMGFAGTDEQWNLETYKPNKGLAGFIASRCN